MSFSSLGLAEALVRAVTEHGYSQPTPIQAQAIPAVLAYNYGLRRVNLYGAELEAFADDFLHHVLKSGFTVR